MGKSPTERPERRSGSNPLSRFLHRTWVPLHARYLDVADLRFIVLLLGFGALLVLVAPQGRDVIATISDSWAETSNSQTQWWLFVAAIAFLGFQSWLWARFLLERRHGSRHHWCDDGLLLQLPRLLGIFPFIVCAIAVWRVPDGHHVAEQAAFLLVLGALAYLGFWKRYRLVEWLITFPSAEKLLAQPVRWGLTTFELLVLGGSVLLAATSLVWLALDPVTFPLWAGSAALAFIGFSLVIPGVCVLMALTWRERFPWLSFFVLVALVVSIFNDNHQVRLLDVARPTRPTIEQAYRQWALQFRPSPGQKMTQPIILVSAAGGASRAALWTTAVLNGLVGDGASSDADIARRIFAITAVSGGSLGAVEYVASLKAADGTPYRAALSKGHASTDFLAPAIGGMLYTDFLQRFLPFPLFRDRAWSIERGFEDGWDRQCRLLAIQGNCVGMLNAPFLDLWKGGSGWRPNLLLVGAIQEDGHRIVTSNITWTTESSGSEDPPRPVLPDTYDFHDVMDREVRASTAVMNSARFSWVSPAGTLKVKRSDRVAGHVIDGGYVEASGVETTLDLFDAIDRAWRVLCDREHICVEPVPIFVTLRNDAIVYPSKKSTNRKKREFDSLVWDACSLHETPSVKEPSLITAERWRPKAAGGSVANDVLAPLRGMLNTQGGRAEITLSRLARRDVASATAQCPAPREVRLIPCIADDERPFAMSWALSQPSRKRMFDEVDRLNRPLAPGATISRCEQAQRVAWRRLHDLVRQSQPAP
ncbi:hypothetical protein [Sphingomonas azotifigens]|uniref:hypothetical protein n=1 Tax=Sphingomonas azotifigens TaxID=330920 RepID=UPI00111BFBCF|nr:hypothetical protein [Sphingomonas azotifigens]